MPEQLLRQNGHAADVHFDEHDDEHDRTAHLDDRAIHVDDFDVDHHLGATF